MRLSLLIIPLLFLPLIINSQSWNRVTSRIPKKGQIDIKPDKSLIYKLDDQAIKSILWSAPNEKEISSFKDVKTVIKLPLADGSFDDFLVIQYDMMEEALAKKYPDIRTFHGRSKNNPHRRMRADYTNYGFRAVIYDDGEDTYIDHYQRNDKEYRVVYFKNDLENKHHWSCGFHNHDEEIREEENNIESRYGDCVFRSYRLAVATTGEYSNFHGATSSTQSNLVLSAVTVVVNRVNGVLEKDVTIRFILIANTTSIFYYNPSTDPYSNGNGSAMLGQNQTTCDNVIGSANYDIGHVFSTGGGGVAYLGCICNNSNKAGGVTGQPNPIGDPFSIDYVAHEMGHQLGANHTQNNNCNRNNATAMEPGSASTIMGYAGICSPNVQNNSDDYYHAISIQEIKNKVQATSCHVPITFVNAPPVMAALTNHSIPVSTPFILTAVATDADNDPLTFCWEQMNNQTATMPPVSTSTVGPAFRSLKPTASSSRYFPPLANVIAGTSNTWQVLPSVSRTMNFRATVRDYHIIAGCTDEENMTVSTVAAGGPFTVTSQNTATVWTENQPATITWNVANTTASPINCANVSILLSYDGGLTYPVTLAASTANDGSETVNIPLGTTTTGRVMVRAVGNVFYDINNANITINASQASFNLNVNTNTLNLCNNSTGTVIVSISGVNGFNNLVNLTVTNLPSGVNGTFSTNPVSSGGNSTLTISNLNSTPTGQYTFTIEGQSGTIIKTQNITLNLSEPLTAPTLVLPTNSATGISLFPSLSWDTVTNANLYFYQVSLSPTFSFLAASGNTSNTNVTLANNLTGNSTYYWRVAAVNNCAGNPWSEVRSFSTSSCFYYNATDVPKTISAGAPSVVTSNIKLYDSGRLSEVQIFNLEGTHTDISNLKFNILNTLSGVNVNFWENPCSNNPANNDDFDINFANNFSTSHPCPPTNGQTYGPTNSFTPFVGVSSYGNWRLTVNDEVTGDGGTLTKWAVQACYLGNYCRRLVDHPYPTGIGSLYDAVNCAFSGDTITIDPNLSNISIDLGGNNIVFNKDIVILGNPNKNISIISSSNNPTFEVSNGAKLTIIGLNIFGSNSIDGAIKNEGNVTLENTKLLKNPSINHTQLIKNIGNSSNLNVIGNCIIRP